MKLEICESDARPFLEICVEGLLDVSSLTGAMRRLAQNKRYQEGANLLYDLRLAELHSVDFDFMNRFMEEADFPRLSGFEPADGGKRRLAFVVPGEAEELVLRLYKAVADQSTSPLNRERRVFRAYDEAVNWLGGTKSGRSDLVGEAGVLDEGR